MIFKKNNVKRSLPRKIGNGIIYFFLGIFLLLILFFGFSQTSTFRNFVKNKILEYTDEAFAAEFNLGSIEGTIFTSLVLKDVSLTNHGDTILAAEKIDIGINPFPLLIKELNFTKVGIFSLNLNLHEKSPGKWNYADIMNQDSSLIVEQIDTLSEQAKSEGEFPFNINLKNLNLNNVDVSLKKYKYQDVNKSYNTINFDNLVIHDLHFLGSIYANINSNEYELDIDSLIFTPNLNKFELENLSGNFQLTKEFAEVQDLSIITDSSNLIISARLDSLNLFGDVELEKFVDYPLKLNFRGEPFTATDLSSFLEPTNFMDGQIWLNLDADGSFGNFNYVSNLKMKRTDLYVNGSLKNLHTPQKLYIAADFKNSKVAYKEVESFLKGLELPSYPDLFVEDINIKYEGEPLKFGASGDGVIGDGAITFGAYMNMYPELIEYNYSFTTNNVNLNSTIGLNSNVNAIGNFRGKGFDPTKSTSKMDLYLYNSFIDKYLFDTLDAKLETTDQLIDLEIGASVDSVGAYVSGLLDLAESNNPIYNLKGNFHKLDLAFLTGDSALTSSLNFEFSVDGHSLDMNETEGSFQLNFINSQIGENHFDSVKFNLDLSLDEKRRSIALKSDLLDFNLSGEYNLGDASKLFAHQVKKVTYSISTKLSELNPLYFGSPDLTTLRELRSNEDIVYNDIYLDYDFEFKDFRIIAALLGRDEISISGTGNGYFENDSSNFSMSTNVDIDYLFLFKEKEVFYISDVSGSMNIGFGNQSYSFDNIFGSFSLDSKRIVSGINMDNLSADFVFNESRIYYNLSSDIEEYINAKLNGDVQIKDSVETLTVKDLGIYYHDFIIENRDPIVFTNSPYQFSFDSFNLYNNDSELKIEGYILNDLTQNITIDAKNFRGGILGRYLLGFSGYDDEITFTLFSEIKGTSLRPIIKLDLAAEDIIINNRNLGSLYFDLDYKDKNLITDIIFTDSTRNTSKPLLTLQGSVQTYIGMDPDHNRIDSLKETELKFNSKDFDIASLGKLIPTIRDQRGLLNANIIISGFQSDLNYQGFMKLKGATFTADIPNLRYGLDFDLGFNNNTIDINSISLKNLDNKKFLGVMNANGKVVTNGFTVSSADIKINGDLALLSSVSQKAMHNLYGDLFIGTDNPLNYKFANNHSYLGGTILIKEADLNFIPAESSYSVSGSDFKYVFIVDSTTYSLQREKYEKLLTALSLKYEDQSESTTLPKNFDLDILIVSEKVSKISVVLSKALNQKLIADVSGNIRITNKGDKLIGQGQFDILSSSMLTFYKTFQTAGNIKFTDDITDPIINITATYEADYVNSRITDAEPVRTAVKIKVKDKLSTLRENIATGENPIDMKIYMGQKNIEYDVASNQYNNLDAMYFILFGTFTSDINNVDLANNAAMSVLGSTLTTMLNANFGDLINNVNFNQSGKQTRFNISGRVQKVRYTVGGTQEVFSDLSQANAKLEYLFTPKFIVRAERKDPVISSSSGNNDKISELGVKYRFSF